MSALQFKVGDVVADELGTIGTILGITEGSVYPYRIRETDGGSAQHSESVTMYLVSEAGQATPALRDSILSTAADLISGQRAKDYGDAAENFQRIADLWKPVLGVNVTREQVALCLTQLKVSRLITSPTHQDSWIDACGYLALGGEIAGKDTP